MPGLSSTDRWPYSLPQRATRARGRSRDCSGAHSSAATSPLVEPTHCTGIASSPKALNTWLQDVRISEGALFRGIDRHGNLHAGGLSGQAVTDIIKAAVQRAGLD